MKTEKNAAPGFTETIMVGDPATPDNENLL